MAVRTGKSNVNWGRLSTGSVIGFITRTSSSPAISRLRHLVTKAIDGVVEALDVEPNPLILSQPENAPWLDEGGRPQWSARRIWAANVVLSKYFKNVLTTIILFNAGLIIFETDQEAKCHPDFKANLDACPTSHKNIIWLRIANDVLLVTYTLEGVVSMYALRCVYVQSPLHMLDMFVCVAGWLPRAGVTFVNVEWLRVFRVLRVLKAARLRKMFERVPELEMLLSAFMGSMRAMFFGTLILLALLCFFSILTVQFVHPRSCQITYDGCDRCARGFRSIADSMLTLFQQIVAGDSWGAISIPVVEDSYVGLILPFIQLVISLGAMNLVLGVVIDQAMDAREGNRIANAAKKAEAHRFRKLQMLDTVRAMDADKSGDLDRDEIYKSVRANVELQTRVALAGLRLDDIEEIVQALTSTGNGNSISYLDFCNVFDDIESADLRKTVVMTKLLLSSMHRDMTARFDQQGRTLAALMRMMVSMVNPCHSVSSPSNTHDIFAQPHADTEEQVQAMTSVPRSPRHHGSPRSDLACDFDARLGKSITDAVMLCEAQIECENKSVQQSLLQLDTKWATCLRALEETLLSCKISREPHEFNARFLDHAMQTHQVLERRRLTLSRDFIDVLETDFRLWVSLYSIHNASENDHEKHDLDHCVHLVHTPRSPRVSWRQTPSDDALKTPTS